MSQAGGEAAFSFMPLPIEGLVVVQPRVLRDSRGYFLETWRETAFAAAGLGLGFVQENQSRSRKGVLRGLHYQVAHPQGKLVRVVCGEAFDVAVDLRRGSATFGRWAAVILSGELQNQLYIPPGFAHGFLALSDEAVCAYSCTELYHPEDEAGIRWDDPTIGIEWPELGIAPILSDKDRGLPAFDRGLGRFGKGGSAQP